MQFLRVIFSILLFYIMVNTTIKIISAQTEEGFDVGWQEMTLVLCMLSAHAGVALFPRTAGALALTMPYVMSMLVFLAEYYRNNGLPVISTGQTDKESYREEE